MAAVHTTMLQWNVNEMTVMSEKYACVCVFFNLSVKLQLIDWMKIIT